MAKTREAGAAEYEIWAALKGLEPLPRFLIIEQGSRLRRLRARSDKADNAQCEE